VFAAPLSCVAVVVSDDHYGRSLDEMHSSVSRVPHRVSVEP